MASVRAVWPVTTSIRSTRSPCRATSQRPSGLRSAAVSGKGAGATCEPVSVVQICTTPSRLPVTIVDESIETASAATGPAVFTTLGPPPAIRFHIRNSPTAGSPPISHLPSGLTVASSGTSTSVRISSLFSRLHRIARPKRFETIVLPALPKARGYPPSSKMRCVSPVRVSQSTRSPFVAPAARNPSSRLNSGFCALANRRLRQLAA